MHWETVNPEWWVPQGYVVVRVDSKGSGKSPGRPRVLSRSEAEDFYDAVEWAGTRDWSNGKVAVMGISYFAMNSWRVASLQPPHLAAIVPWEGAADGYRDVNRHGGIYSSGFTQSWAKNVSRYEHKGEDRNKKPAEENLPPLYPELFTPAQERSNPNFSEIKVPLLSAGNWAGAGLHLRGNIEGFAGAGSEHKFLQVHVGNHVVPFYSLEGRLTQKRFLEQFLKGIDTGITREPHINLAIRYVGDQYKWRYEDEWPIARTQWTEYYLDASDNSLSKNTPEKESSTSFETEPEADNPRVTFSSVPFEKETEITGPIKLALWVSSSINDADLFIILRKYGPDGKEVTFTGPSPTGNTVAGAYGWLRVSHRKLDPQLSEPYRPYHTHDEIQKVQLAEIVPVEIEVWPTSIVFEPRYRLVLEIASKDDDATGFSFLHVEPRDRIQTGTNTIYTGGKYTSHLLLPIIPPR